VAQVSDRLPDMRMPLLGPQSEQRTRINAPPSYQGYLLPWQEMVDGWLTIPVSAGPSSCLARG